MNLILIQSISFLLVIFVSYGFKVGGLLKKEDGQVISKILLNITLPATIVIGFNAVKIDITLLVMILLGIFTNIVLIAIGGAIWRNKNPKDRALMMFGQAGYNIGNFTIPFVQGFFPEAIPFIGSFDTGNALMAFGGNATVVDKLSKGNHKTKSIREIIAQLFSSTAFTTYIVMIVLAIVNITIPENILATIQLFANSNSFLSMLLIGLYLEINISKKDLSKVSQVLLIRYILGIILALVFYFALPFSMIIRISLVMIALAPIGTIATINMVDYGNKESVSGFVSSSSIIISIVLMTIALYFIL